MGIKWVLTPGSSGETANQRTYDDHQLLVQGDAAPLLDMVPVQNTIKDVHDTRITDIRMSVLGLLMLPGVEVNGELGEKVVSTSVFTPDALAKNLMVAARPRQG